MLGVLFREIKAQGYPGCRQSVCRWAQPLRQDIHPSTRADVRAAIEARQEAVLAVERALPLSISPRDLLGLIWRDPARLQLDEQQALDTLAQRLPWVTEVGLLVQAFRSLLWSKQPDQVEGWLRTALHSDLPDLRLFAESLPREQAALEAAVALPWS